MDRAMLEWAGRAKGPRWARIRDGVCCRLRRGAWYPVLSAGSHSVVLDVRGMSVSVHHGYLVLTVARPTGWSIVRRPPDSGLMPESWGAWYAVCPGCAAREPVGQVAGAMACRRCDQSFPIDWSASATPLDERTRPTPAQPHAV